ncbi:hypothetical protein [Paenibacillus cremeus]|uniref:Uncharacterized protein n=1 Tax=Paenibacillus cremeus TaxID=2163881 RepID=A0A559KAD9_9BACL|nr:hypothetical protein [Paenibacillus cremeus]TVY09096.1 hypothetical protein FPZ49_15410 [Paenibacillus cremeus]
MISNYLCKIEGFKSEGDHFSYTITYREENWETCNKLTLDLLPEGPKFVDSGNNKFKGECLAETVQSIKMQWFDTDTQNNLWHIGRALEPLLPGNIESINLQYEYKEEVGNRTIHLFSISGIPDLEFSYIEEDGKEIKLYAVRPAAFKGENIFYMTGSIFERFSHQIDEQIANHPKLRMKILFQ